MARAYKEEFARMMGNNKAFLESNKALMEGNKAAAFLESSGGHSKAFMEGGPQLLKPGYLNFPGFPPVEDFVRPPGDLHQVKNISICCRLCL
jgi:hypothetical protein